MLCDQGFIRFAEFIHYLNANTAASELEVTRHSFGQNRWCIGNTDLGRWLQVSVSADDKHLEIDYLLKGFGHQTQAVFAVEQIAERALKYLRGEATQI